MPGAGRKSGTEQRNASNDYPYREGFEPTELLEEKDSGGWLRTTRPEGADPLHEIITAGSRGAAVPKPPTVGRTRRRRAQES